MNGDYIKCSACRAEYHRKSEHDCPGSPSDQAARIQALEERVNELDNEIYTLKSMLGMKVK